MSNQKDVDIAINEFAQATVGAIPCVYGNQDDASLANGKAPYVKLKVVFKSDRQHGLGDVDARRHDGLVVIILNARKGTGDAARDNLYNSVVKPFRSHVIGGATFLDPQLVAQGNTDNWNLTGWQIPFYFYE